MSKKDNTVVARDASYNFPTVQAKSKKFSWFHSLTRCKKKHQQLNTDVDASTLINNNNNNEPLARRCNSTDYLIYSPLHESLSFNFIFNGNQTADKRMKKQEPEFRLFSDNFKRFIIKKWLQHEEGANAVMFKASNEMLNQVWYWGEVSRIDAQKHLTGRPTGTFLVRDSETRGCQFTLSLRIFNITLHYRLEYKDNYWHFEELKYKSIVKMIEDILCRCSNDLFVCFVKAPNDMLPPFPVILKYPLSRYVNMITLQDLCRRVIQAKVKGENICELPIPPALQKYLMEKRELIF